MSEPALSALVVDFDGERRCLSSAVVGGGLRTARAWLNLQVRHGYARLDPDVHLREEMAARGLDPATTLGAMTAAHVDRATEHAEGGARAIATVGIGVPLAAAGRILREVPAVNTINIVVLTDAPLTDAGLVYAVQTATEAKTQALADAGIAALNHAGPATGTATDSICIAARPGETEAFAGPMAPAGAAIARCVHAAVLEGALAFRGAAEEERATGAAAEAVASGLAGRRPSAGRSTAAAPAVAAPGGPAPGRRPSADRPASPATPDSAAHARRP